MFTGIAFTEDKSGVVCPPWETAPYGVVSLLAMLEFSARDYIEMANQIGILLGSIRGKQPDVTFLGNKLGDLGRECDRLNLLITKEHITTMMFEIMGEQGSNVQFAKDGTVTVKGGLEQSRVCHHIESIYVALRGELGALLFKVIPLNRARYNNSGWLKTSIIQSSFPTSFKELERAGICYSLGQPTASVFHSMRALEPSLIALAKPFPHISPAYENWQTIIEQIESAVRAIGQQPKSQQKIDDEKFYGAATSHLYFVKNAWRNHVAHARDSYSDDEAVKILSHTLEFIESLCPRLQE
jgi:hypothetical protein